MKSTELKAKYYIRLFKEYEHLQEFYANYLYINNVKNFSKFDDDLINDITEGRVCNEKDGVTATWGGRPLGRNISILIPNWYIFCLFELFEEDCESNQKHINVIGKKFGEFVTSYVGDNDKCFIALIDADKFDTIITTYLDNIQAIYHYKRIEFVEYDLAKRMNGYFKGDVIPLLFQKRPKYKERLSEKRLGIHFHGEEGEKDFIRLKIKGISDTILFKGFIDKDIVLRHSMSNNGNL